MTTSYPSRDRRTVLSVAAVLAVACLVLPKTRAVGEEFGWEADWISVGEEVTPNSWFAFRKTFSLENKPQEAVARIACDSKYWLWINGDLVVFEGGLKRGPNPADSYFDPVDLVPHLKAGENTVAVLVWYFGRQGMSHRDSGQPGLVFDLRADGTVVASDKTWRGIRHPAYGRTSEPHPNWRLPESNLHYDARRGLSGWEAAGYDDRDWPHAIPRGRPPAAPWNQLVERPIPLWRGTGLKDYENAGEFPPVATGQPITAKLPHNAQVTPFLEVEAAEGQLIRIETDNYRGGGEPNVRAEYITQEGRQTHESLGWMNGHEVVYLVPEGVKIHALKYRETGYDTAFSGSFACDDERLNVLWRKAQRTLYVNMRDTYFDCPGRERAQWWGDVTLELQQAFYGLGRRSDRLSRKAVLDLAEWQKPDGVLASPVPAGNWDKELPMQMLASVGRFGFWEYYRHTGDRDTIERVYPAVARYLALWELGEDGLVVERQGAWTWGDWGTNKDLPLLYNAWYYLALDGQARMAELLNEPRQAGVCRQSMKTLRDAFNREFWTAAGYRSPKHEGTIDDRGNALAVISGLADLSKHQTIGRVLTTERHASPYMEKYVLEALIQLGLVDSAFDRMLERYGPMIESPISTLWEGWGVGPAGYGGGSYNHAWAGGPLTLLSQYNAGINPIEPGYHRFEIAPRLGRLKHVSATVASPRGEIRVAFARNDDAISGKLVVPNNSLAVLRLPYYHGATLAWHDAEAATHLKTGDKLLGGEVMQVSDSKISIAIEPGSYAFRLSLRIPR